jgi:thiamine-phosphate pyrophosphorylase
VRGLHVLADDGAGWRHDPVAIARGACEGAASVVQLRAKRAGDRQSLAWAAEIRALTRAHGLLFVFNDRFDLALAADADGVHLGQDDLPPARIPAGLREHLIVGRSTHTLEQAKAASGEPVDYVAFGPVFGTRSKTSPYAPRGLEMLAEVVALVAPRPVVAIGGIDASNASQVVAAGAAGAAVIAAVAAAEDPAWASRALVHGLGRDPSP